VNQHKLHMKFLPFAQPPTFKDACTSRYQICVPH